MQAWIASSDVDLILIPVIVSQDMHTMWGVQYQFHSVGAAYKTSQKLTNGGSELSPEGV
jgi:hypothetical protein